MESNNQLSRLNTDKILEIIDKIPNLTEDDRHELSLKIAKDDVDIRKTIAEKLAQSQSAHYDLVTIMGEITALNKEGVYIKSKQTIETGSGKFEIELKGGDKKLIVPVLLILSITVIIVMLIMFWG